MHNCVTRNYFFLFSYDVGQQWKIEVRTAFVNNNFGEDIIKNLRKRFYVAL